ncbi:hypothetical protein NC651_019446 [Populus alba x Populus x berolinensis]|nr:hypothetical protein NC651_019446 [Populus alba x Populus x berolinensis]
MKWRGIWMEMRGIKKTVDEFYPRLNDIFSFKFISAGFCWEALSGQKGFQQTNVKARQEKKNEQLSFLIAISDQ